MQCGERSVHGEARQLADMYTCQDCAGGTQSLDAGREVVPLCTGLEAQCGEGVSSKGAS